MTTRGLHEVFARLPKLDALHRRLLKAAREQPGMVLVASTPFLVYRDGSLSGMQVDSPWFISAEDVDDDESVLYGELELVANGIEEGRYSKKELRRLEFRSKRIKKFIRSLLIAADAFHDEHYAIH
jgi:hypothetical protein